MMAIQVVVMIGAPTILVRFVRARWGVSWATIGAGALTFVASQVLHVPFNAYIMPLLPGQHHALHLVVVASFLGLSAGLFEETARYVALRFMRRDDRSCPHAIGFGAGHGGAESIILGILALHGLFQILVIHQVGVENLGLDPAERALVASQLAIVDHMPAATPLLGALERLFTLPFHVAASCLVMRAVMTRRIGFWLAAVLTHALFDGVGLFVALKLGPVAAEGWLFLTVPVSLAIMVSSIRALPTLGRPNRGARPIASGAPVELASVVKIFGEGANAVTAVDGIVFTLREGERCCLLGPNGAGKTTSIRLITGALTPTRGHAFVYGSASEDDTFLAQKRRVGIVPQQPGMYPEMTVSAYLEFVRELYGSPESADSVTAQLGLSEVLDRPTSELSGGMQRRLALAAALLPRPELLVLDEPSAGLDPIAARQMIECVREASRGRTTLLCTHNLAEAEALCETVVILRAGKVVTHASIAELKKTIRPRIALQTSGNRDDLIAALRRHGCELEDSEDEVRVLANDLEADVPRILRAMLDDSVPILECRVVRATLEEIFFRVVDARDSNPGGAA